MSGRLKLHYFFRLPNCIIRLAVLSLSVHAGDGAATSARPVAAVGAEAGILPASVRATVVFGKFKIRGTPAFAAKTKDALILLEDAATFATLSPYIAVIEESTRSGMVAWSEKPTFQAGSRTWNSDTAWYAGAIAHDGCHSMLYHKAKTSGNGKVPAEAWTGKKAEQECLAIQAEVLREIKAPKYFLDYVKGLVKNPTYQDISYSSRSW